MQQSTKDQTYGKTERAKGTGAGTMEEMKAKAYDAKAAVKEGLGYDATADRATATEHRATGNVKETTHDVKGGAYTTKGKVEEKFGH